MEVHRSAQKAMCEFRGRLLYENLPGLNLQMEELLKEGVKVLTIKLDPRLVLDSAALGMFLSLSAKADAQGARLSIIAPGGEVRSVLNTTRLDEILNILSDEEALAITSQFSDP
jgi:anti-anti-sigma regulatory factor